MEQELFVHFAAFKLDPSWRRLSGAEKERGKSEFIEAIKMAKEVTTYSYSTLGLKAEADLLLWNSSPSVEAIQDLVSRLLQSRLGHFLDLTTSLTGMIRPSVYVSKHDPQAQAIYARDRRKYLIIYPFTKTSEWYLLDQKARQEMMSEHIGVGKKFTSVRQVLAYSFGLDDQEFIVAYETDSLKDFQDLVKALRETRVRAYTLKDTPIFVGIHRPHEGCLALLG